MRPPSRIDATVVVCEDDQPTRALLVNNLTADRFQVLEAATAADALRHLRYRQPDLLLLDLDLPDASGLEVLRKMRGETDDGVDYRCSVPVILLSGFGDEPNRVRCLNAGADDFLQKPVRYQELLARIQAVLRRCRPGFDSVLRVDGLLIDRSRRLVLADGKPLELSRKEYLMLCTLATDPQRTFTKTELLTRIWGIDTMRHSRTLDAHASRLRRKLDPTGRRYVFNVWGVGYKLLGDQA